MKYVLNKCIIESKSGELVWSSTKPEGKFAKMETILRCDSDKSKELFNKFNLNHDDIFKIVIYLKDESKAKKASGEVVYRIFRLFDFFGDGYCLTKDSMHKSN